MEKTSITLAASTFIMVAASLLLVRNAGAKGPKHPKENEGNTPPAAVTTGDLNESSLRVTAMERIVEFDLSPEQLRLFRAAAPGSADARQRSPAKAGPKLGAAIKDLQEALLRGDSAEHILEFRDKVGDLKDDDDTQLDDEVRVTDAARAKAGDLFRRIKASQIAAYLVDHVDEVPDPVEQMMDALADIRDADAENPDVEVRDTSEEVGRIVAGLDGAKGRQVAEQVAAWLKAGRQLKDEEFAAKRATLEESGKKIVGDLSAMDVLTHWLENEVAALLSNPQLVSAIDAVVAAGPRGK